MRKVLSSIAAAATLATGAPARADTSAGMQLVARIPYLQGTHLEFHTRTADGVRRVYAFAGSRDADDAGLRIIDVTDPATPQVVAHVTCPQHNNDVGISPDGRWALLASDGSTRCTAPSSTPGFRRAVNDVAFVDITDISAPRLLGTPSTFPRNLDGIHTLVFHPSQNVAYLANQTLPSRNPTLSIAYLDGATWQHASVALPPTGSGPHDITFNRDGTRAYVSSITVTLILDTTNPLAPTVISVIADPLINIHHEAFLHPNGRHLFIVDEQAGAIVNPACPGGGVHVFDLFDERAPIPVGFFFAQDVRPLIPQDTGNLPACTAHEGTFSADGTLLSLGWYWAGARVFDTSALTTPGLPPGFPVGLLVRERAFYTPDPSDVWAAKMHPALPGYVFASNTAQGFEVYRLGT